MRNIWLYLILGIIGVPVCSAQHTPVKTDVNVDCTCVDNAGKLYATALRNLVASSPRYSLAREAELKDSSGKILKYNVHIRVVFLDASENDNGLRTVISAVVLMGNNSFINNMVQTCGRDVVASCAASTLASLDELMNS